MGQDISSRHTSNPSAPAAGFSALYPFGASDAATVYRFIRADGTVGNFATLEGDNTFTGSNTFTGTVTNINVTNLSVTDSLIRLAAGNAANVLDIGTYGVYQPAATPLYSGLFRDATDGIYKLFDSLQAEPTTTVNTAGTGYAAAALTVGAFNAAAITASGAITANAGLVVGASQAITGTVANSTISGFLSIAATTGTFTNVGIGTTTPGKLTEISKNVAASDTVENSTIIRLLNTGSDGTSSIPNRVGIGFGNSTTRQAIVGGTYGYDFLDFYTAEDLTNAKVRIDAVGNVGIGTTGSLAKLGINGGLHVGGDSDPGDNNALIDGTLGVTGAVTTNGGLQTFGANNSGGAGYRLVVVPNV